VTSDNDFPTGAGLASSAAGFAALAVAAAAALDFAAPPGLLNAMARIGSGSAPRSLFGGFALLENADDDITCRQLRPAEEWPLAVIVAVTNAGPKAVSSRAGMAQSRTTSPYYAEWVRSHPVDLVDGIACVARRDFDGLAAVAERSCLKMHAVMQTTAPPLLYWEPATLACMQTIGVLRREGTPVFFTIDAGPQVKAVCLPAAADAVRSALASTPGVTQLIQCRLGAGAHRVDG
jgi:diphosphomevalonate decarboxylase